MSASFFLEQIGLLTRRFQQTEFIFQILFVFLSYLTQRLKGLPRHVTQQQHVDDHEYACDVKFSHVISLQTKHIIYFLLFVRR